MGSVKEQSAAIDDPKLQEIVDILVTEIDPEIIILFGSRVDGDTDENSDYDLLVVTEVEREKVSAVRRAMRQSLSEVKAPMDLVVVPSSEFKTERRMSCSTVRSAWENGRVLYGERRRYSDTERLSDAKLDERVDRYLARARENLEFSGKALEEGISAPPRQCAYFSREAAEKILLAILIANRFHLAESKTLTDLIGLCRRYHQLPPDLESEFEELSDFTLDVQYPDGPAVKTGDAEQAHRVALDLFRSLDPVLQELGFSCLEMK